LFLGDGVVARRSSNRSREYRMTPVEENLLEAVAQRDADGLRSMLAESTFVVISIISGDETDEDEISTLRAEVSDFEALVAFTSETKASVFVQEMEDLFEEDDEVEGMFVDGEALMDLLADGLGLLLNPEDESAAVIDPELAKLIAA
jgi:hypothetical protein